MVATSDRTVVFLTFEGASLLDISGPLSVLTLVKFLKGTDALPGLAAPLGRSGSYNCQVASIPGGPVMTLDGVSQAGSQCGCRHEAGSLQRKKVMGRQPRRGLPPERGRLRPRRRQRQGDRNKCRLGRSCRRVPCHAPPAEQKARLEPMPARNRRDVRIRPRSFRDNHLLLRLAPASPCLGNNRIPARKTIPRYSPRPSSYCINQEQQDLYPPCKAALTGGKPEPGKSNHRSCRYAV